MSGLVNRPTPPILVFAVDDDGTDMSAFGDVRMAEGAMEQPEVREGLYTVLDSEGYEARLGLPRWEVKIDGWSQEPHVERLRELLTAFLAEGDRSILVSDDLAQVVHTAAIRARELNEGRTPPMLRPVVQWLRSLRHRLT